MEKHALHVSIIGGGIGGLATASALQRQGIQVTVFERIRSGRCPGQGQCSPHPFRVLVLAGETSGQDATGRHGTAGGSTQHWYPPG